MERIRVVVADRDSSFRKNLKDRLNTAGYLVIGEAEDGMSALKLVRSLHPDIVLTSVSLPALSGFELARIIEEGKLAAVILMAEYSEKDEVYKAGDKKPSPVLIKPFDDIYLFSLLEYSYSAFVRMTELEAEVRRLKKDLETRKTVEKAKGILMKAQGLTEDEAYKRMQNLSMNKRTSMKNIAQAIITAHEMMGKDR